MKRSAAICGLVFLVATAVAASRVPQAPRTRQAPQQSTAPAPSGVVREVVRIHLGPGADSPAGKQFSSGGGRLATVRSLTGGWRLVTPQVASSMGLMLSPLAQGKYIWIFEHPEWHTPADDYFTVIVADTI